MPSRPSASWRRKRPRPASDACCGRRGGWSCESDQVTATARALRTSAQCALPHVFGLFLLVCGCAAAPPWHRGHLDELAEYYDQGVGGGGTAAEAERNAQVALVAYRHGIQVRSVTGSQIQSFSRNGDELVFQLITDSLTQQVAGALPAGTYIAERWRDQDGSWWSYALSERPGEGPRIRRLVDSRMRMARVRAIVPGWAQFTKHQERKGWAIVTGEALSVVGWLALDALTAEYRSQRNQAATVTDYRYYDRWSDRFAWGAAGCASLAAATYLASAIDGIANRPPAYRLLMTQVYLDVRPGAGYLVRAALHLPAGA